jgi:hypothetical protein
MTTPAMPAGAVPQRPSGKTDHRSHTLTLWSLAMIPATAISVVAAVLLGNALMNATGTPEGELLISAGFAGWLAWIAVTLTMLSAPLMGVLLGLLARRPDGDHGPRDQRCHRGRSRGVRHPRLARWAIQLGAAHAPFPGVAATSESERYICLRVDQPTSSGRPCPLGPHRPARQHWRSRRSAGQGASRTTPGRRGLRRVIPTGSHRGPRDTTPVAGDRWLRARQRAGVHRRSWANQAAR